MKFHILWPNGLVVIATFLWQPGTSRQILMCAFIYSSALHIIINTNKVSQFPLCRGSISKQSRVPEMHNLSDIRWWSVVSLAISSRFLCLGGRSKINECEYGGSPEPETGVYEK